MRMSPFLVVCLANGQVLLMFSSAVVLCCLLVLLLVLRVYLKGAVVVLGVTLRMRHPASNAYGVTTLKEASRGHGGRKYS